MKEECKITNNNKIVIFEENRSKLIIENLDEENSTKIIVDGCQITEGIRCDFLYLIKGFEIFIELKGQDLEHALEQIKNTIIKLSVDPKKGKKKSFVICTRSPLNSATIQNLQVKFRRDYNSDLIIKSSPYKYKI